MNASLDVLIRELEELWKPEERELTLESLEARLSRRGEILALIQKTDTTHLASATTHELARRLREVQRHDQELLRLLEQKREEVVAELEKLSHARAAVRGYGSLEGPDTEGLRRIA